jgi:hypothetical protein
VGPTSCLDGCERFCLYQDSIPGPSNTYRLPSPVPHFTETILTYTDYTKCANAERRLRTFQIVTKREKTNCANRRSFHIFPKCNQQDAMFLDLFISSNCFLHVSGSSSAHHQEHKTVRQVLSTNTAACCCRE